MKRPQDANFAVNISLQTLQEHRTYIYAIFVDLKEAYDTINREFLCKILSKYGILKND